MLERFADQYDPGEVAEWLKAPVSKTGISGNRDRGFESRPLRHDWHLFSRLGVASRIMTTNLFSSYRQGENRVTHTFLAVLQRLSLPNMDRILQALLEDSAFSLVTFENQPNGLESTPDAKIATRSSVWIETKTTRGAVSLDQIEKHLKSRDAGDYLLLLTPDDDAPNGLHGLGERVAWSNFERLSTVIDGILASDDYPPTETEAFLLRELISMLRQDGLIGASQSDVLVVAAGRTAWSMYEGLGVYRCQPGRSFHKTAKYLAFYADGEIKPRIAKIKSGLTIESIDINDSDAVNRLDVHRKESIRCLREEIGTDGGWREEFAGPYKVMFLSDKNDEATITLSEAIPNDLTDRNGRRTAFTLGHRYVELELLKSARTTSEVVKS